MKQIFAVIAMVFSLSAHAEEIPQALRVGRAGHAFDHLGAIGEQAEAAAASGATIIYASGVGTLGYEGLPPANEFEALRAKAAAYCRGAKEKGIDLNIGYLCATSIVKLDTFDKNWPDDFRAQFRTRPAEWRQQDRNGQPLASWYGGDYAPACMNNPEWRAYERAMVQRQLECGHDGIFFDNPTVHPQGCYCPHCMQAFAKFAESGPLAPREENVSRSETSTLEAIRNLAEKEHERFLRFRSTTSRDFLKDMRDFARTINPKALATCNNSLNLPSVFYSQGRLYGYNIHEMSKVEDIVVVEDMSSQPRVEANGQTVEYGPVYKMLHAISHKKPVVAVTLANGDYHTPPNLVRLAMAEAVANNASYLSWPTWPEDQRQRMIAAIRPQADFLRRNEELLHARFRADVAIYLPFQRWAVTDECGVSVLAAALTRQNIQFRVMSEDDLDAFASDKDGPPLLVESRSVFTAWQHAAIEKLDRQRHGVVSAEQPDWLAQLRGKIGRASIEVEGSPNVRAIVHDQPKRTIVHLYNLNVQRLSSLEDKVSPVSDVKVKLWVPFAEVRSVKIDSADEDATWGDIQFTSEVLDSGRVVSATIPKLTIHSIVVVEP